jgi:hypothetical protein
MRVPTPQGDGKFLHLMAPSLSHDGVGGFMEKDTDQQ